MSMKLKSEVDDVLYFGIALGLLLRWSTSVFPYSGFRKPPMYGDYEAQRHWMEITVNLPADQWYENNTQNDLLYWGLDYPPLTAYHSLICGYIAQWFDESWVMLKYSRGHESYHHKIFMRTMVIVADLLICVPAIVLYWNAINKPYRPREKAIAATLALLYPGLILIDHGHFQFNCVSLGLCLWGVLLLSWDHDLLGAFAFTLALNYKQMELYHAFPFFFYLLGTCSKTSISVGIRKFFKLALIVLITTAVCWAPYLGDTSKALQVFRRLFPFDRGVYEDKVANVWYCLSIIIKLKQLYPVSTLALASGVITIVVSSISSIHLLRHPTLPVFRISLVNSALLFFLFSYQVHEKSILLAAVPALLLIDDYPLEVSWFLTLSTFSMFPLLAKDGLVIPYFALSVLFLVAVVKGMSLDTTWKMTTKSVIFVLSLLGCLVLSVAALAVRPPRRYPDLHSFLNCVYSCAHFVVFTLYFHYVQLKQPCLETTKLKIK